MGKVYYVSRSEYREDGNDWRLIAIHETLTGAVLHLNELVIKERDEYIENLDDSGKEEVKEMWHEDPDGTMGWHIWLPCDYNEVFIEVFVTDLLD